MRFLILLDYAGIKVVEVDDGFEKGRKKLAVQSACCTEHVVWRSTDRSRYHWSCDSCGKKIFEAGNFYSTQIDFDLIVFDRNRWIRYWTRDPAAELEVLES